MLVALIAAGCNTNQRNASVTVDLNAERDAVQATIRGYFDAYGAEDWNQVAQHLTTSNEFQFYGTDSAEVHSNLDDFQQQLSNDWQLLDDIQVGEPRRLSLVNST